METIRTEKLTLDEIQSVYSGKHGCACGCKGKHSYRSIVRSHGDLIRGYALDDEDVNDRIVARHLSTINAAIERGEATNGDGYVAFETETRTFVAYLIDAKLAAVLS